MSKIFRQIFAFLSSVQLAVFVLLGLAAVLAVGTFFESSYDTETAHYYVYGTSKTDAIFNHEKYKHK